MHAWPLEMSSNDEQRDRRWIGEEEEEGEEGGKNFINCVMEINSKIERSKGKHYSRLSNKLDGDGAWKGPSHKSLISGIFEH